MPDTPAPVASPAIDPAQFEELKARTEELRGAVGVLARGATTPAPPANPGPDPFKKFTTEGAGLTADAAAELLAQGVNERVSAVATDLAKRVDIEMNRRMAATAQESAIQAALDANPGMDRRGLLAASAKVSYDLTQSRKNVSPQEFVRESVKQWREDNVKPPAPEPVPHTEGASKGASAEASMQKEKPAEAPVEQTRLEEIYGMDPGEINDFNKENIPKFEGMTASYVDDKNEGLEKKSVFSRVAAVTLPLRMRRRQRAKVAAAGG